MVRRNTWDNYLTFTEGSLRRVQFREARHSGKSVGQSDQVALRVNYNTFCELFITDDNICSIIVLHHACHFVSNLGYNLIYFPQIYALYCPILEQCKVAPSPSKKNLPNVQNEGGGGQRRFEQCSKTADLVKRYIPNA